MRNTYGAAHAADPCHAASSVDAGDALPLRLVEPCGFPHLQHGYYDKFRLVFQNGGYRHLGDFECPARNGCPHSLDAPTMLRFLASPSGHIVAGYWHLVPRLGRRLRTLASGLASLRLDATRDFLDGIGLRHVVQLHTGFDDGSFLLTTNSASEPSAPAGVEVAAHPGDTSPGQLLKLHRKRVSEIIRSGSGRTPMPVRDEAELQRMLARLQALRADPGPRRTGLRADRGAFAGPARHAA